MLKQFVLMHEFLHKVFHQYYATLVVADEVEYNKIERVETDINDV